MDRYEYRRSTRLQFFLICHEGGFDALPVEVRHMGPWFGRETGEVVRLKPKYRLELARKGYVVVNEPLARFEPEASSKGAR